MSDQAYQFLTDFINNSRYVECAEAAHTSWLKIKKDQGWKYGPKRDQANKVNPMLVEFGDLPEKLRNANSATPYAVANFFRKQANGKTLAELRTLFQNILDGKEPELLEELAEYVHSHFIINLISSGETTQTRRDMVVYEDLDDDTKSWDAHIAQEVIQFLIKEIDK
jgi:hypothetical protein